MRLTIPTGIITLLAMAPVVVAQPAAKESASVSWQYYADKTPLSDPLQPADMKTNLRCSVIASDADGAYRAAPGNV